MAPADETLPSALKKSADCTAPLPPSPPVNRMRPSFMSTVAAPERGWVRLAVPVQLPIVMGGRVALRIPAEKIRARMIQRRFGAVFIFHPRANRPIALAGEGNPFELQ